MDVKCPKCGKHEFTLIPMISATFYFSADGEGCIKKNVEENAVRNYKSAFSWSCDMFHKHQERGDCIVCNNCYERFFPLLTDTFTNPDKLEGHGFRLLGVYNTAKERDEALEKIKLLDKLK